jgi:large subunit ribosomal protein L31
LKWLDSNDILHKLSSLAAAETFQNIIERGTNMKEGIHPGYKECKVTCACGNTFMTLSDKAEMRVDICSECHPFFTGQQKFANRGGRVEKFKNKYGLK